MAGSTRPNPGHIKPSGHKLHTNCASILLNLPGGHGNGSQCPSLGQYVPAGQAIRAPKGEKYPGGQSPTPVGC